MVLTLPPPSATSRPDRIESAQGMRGVRARSSNGEEINLPNSFAMMAIKHQDLMELSLEAVHV